MEIKFELTKESFLKSTKNAVILSYKRILLFSAGMAVFASVIDGFQHGFEFSHFLLLSSVAFLALLFTIIIILFFKFRKTYKKIKLYQRLEYIYAIFPEGIKLEKLSGNLYFRWDEIRNISLKDLHMVINLRKGPKYYIPLSAFIDEEQQNEFINAIKQHLSISNLLPQKHPSYWRGLLGLLPVIGLVNGVIMLRAGITNYNNKIYSLIGLAGIILNFTMFYWTDNHNLPVPIFMRAGFTTNAQMELNGLVKEVEFYKLQTGNYPDSLQQLNTKEEFLDIYDPLAEGKKAKPFNYYRIGSKYTLFSSGLDEKPNTADDIYPNVDTAKTGLIIQKTSH